MPGSLIKALLLSCVVASISFFVSHTQLLAKPRKWLWHHALFFGMLVDCCYCLGHWVAAALLLVYPVRLFDAHGLVGYALTWLVVAWLAGLQSMVATRLWGE